MAGFGFGFGIGFGGNAFGGASGPLRALPLGDSITQGFGSTGPVGEANYGGYRYLMWLALRAAGKDVVFCGLQKNGPTALVESAGAFFPQLHEGNGGFRVDQIEGTIRPSVASNRPIDVVLFIGSTNDNNQSVATATIAARFRTLFATLREVAPAAKVLWGRTPPSKIAGMTTRAQANNAEMPAIIAECAAAGQTVVNVDLFTPLNAALIADPNVYVDNLHPANAGYQIIADAFVPVLAPLAPSL